MPFAKMQKVILDTNVIVSALIQKGFPYLILQELLLEQAIQLCISEDLMSEYYEVLNRDKFARFPDFKVKADAILVYIAEKAVHYIPQEKIRKIKDESDNMLVELAIESGANFLITGNTSDFTIKKYKRTKIVTPRDIGRTISPIHLTADAE